ncbi:hypothetical protein ABZT28_54780 [Streptomyces sp. NPDC005388]|uniref:hypothetical protein n=1 Tax=Streptomyces sp. NPDC005388 TaxID=3156717 RepID=UPI0033B34330
MPCGAGAQQLCPRSAARAASKADQDPGTWRPPAQGYRCQYATDWIADKTRWGLSIDPTEHAALTEALSNGPDQPITVPLARWPPHHAVQLLRSPTVGPLH